MSLLLVSITYKDIKICCNGLRSNKCKAKTIMALSLKKYQLKQMSAFFDLCVKSNLLYRNPAKNISLK